MNKIRLSSKMESEAIFEKAGKRHESITTANFLRLTVVHMLKIFSKFLDISRCCFGES